MPLRRCELALEVTWHHHRKRPRVKGAAIARKKRIYND
jgi:hypothetical protein